MAGASADDLEEIAEGKASARDKREAGVHSPAEARRRLQHGHALKVRTTHKARSVKRKIKHRKL
jgi:hypothetical protein